MIHVGEKDFLLVGQFRRLIASPGLSPYGYRSPGYGSSGGSSSPDGGGVTPFGSSPGSPYYSSP
jgi:hypothetical protein